jgi:dolichyl-diphosphooligosaccharide--protein glycosyltransferase
VAGGSGYVSYPRDWLKGIFEARPLFADGPSLAWRQLSAAFFLSPLAILLWLSRARRGEASGVGVGGHVALAVWGAVTILLAAAQRLNVYYAAVLAGATLVEVARFVVETLARRETAPRLRALAAAAAVLILASPSARALSDEVRSVRVAGSDLFATLDWMRRELPHEVDAYDPRLLEPAGPPELGRASSVMAPWSLGHMLLYDAELPVVANNFGYGFLDSIRFFLAEDEAEALAIARARRVRWVVVTDLVPRMNDYSAYLGRAPLLEPRGASVAPTDRYFATMQSRLYDFDGAGGGAGAVSSRPLSSFRLRFHSKSAIRRGNRWLARWKVFEIVEPSAPADPQRVSP